MVLNHIAAILFFAGPLFYIGVWMALDPAGAAGAAGSLVRLFANGERIRTSRRLKMGVRFAGLALVLFAVAL